MSCYIPYPDLEATLYSAYKHDFNKYKNLSSVIESVMELSVPAEAKIHAIWYYAGFVNSAAYKVPELQTKEWEKGVYLNIHNYLAPYLKGELDFDFDTLVEEITGMFPTELEIIPEYTTIEERIQAEIDDIASVADISLGKTVDSILSLVTSNIAALDPVALDPNVTTAGQILNRLKQALVARPESPIKYTLIGRVNSVIQAMKQQSTAAVEYIHMANVDGIGLHKSSPIQQLRRANGELVAVYYDKTSKSMKYFAPGTEIHETDVERRNGDQITAIYEQKDNAAMVNPETGQLRMRPNEVLTGLSLGETYNVNEDTTVQQQISADLAADSDFYTQVRINATTYGVEFNQNRLRDIQEAFPNIGKTIDTNERPAQAAALAQGKGPILTYVKPASGFTVTVTNFQGNLSFDLKPFTNLAFLYPDNQVVEFDPNNGEHVALLKSMVQVRTSSMEQRYENMSDREVDDFITALNRYNQFKEEVEQRLNESGAKNINIKDIFYKYYDLTNNVVKVTPASEAKVTSLQKFINSSNGRLPVKLVAVDAQNNTVGEPFFDKIPLILRQVKDGSWRIESTIPDNHRLVSRNGNTYRTFDQYLIEEGIDIKDYVARTFSSYRAVYISFKSVAGTLKPVGVPIQYQRQVISNTDLVDMIGGMQFAIKNASTLGIAAANRVMVEFNNTGWGFDVNKTDGIRPEVVVLRSDEGVNTFGIRFIMLESPNNTAEQRERFNDYAKKQMAIPFNEGLTKAMFDTIGKLLTEANIKVPENATSSTMSELAIDALNKLGEDHALVKQLREEYSNFLQDIRKKFQDVISRHDRNLGDASPIINETFRQYGLFDGASLKLYKRRDRKSTVGSYNLIPLLVEKELNLTYRNPLKTIILPPARISGNSAEIKAELANASPVATVDVTKPATDPTVVQNISDISFDPDDLDFESTVPFELADSLEAFFALSPEEQSAEIAAMRALLPAAFQFTTEGFEGLKVDGHALGYVRGLMIHLNSTLRAKGTAFHEGFHGVFRNLLTRDHQVYYLTKAADALGGYKTDGKGKYIQVGKKKVYANEFRVRRRYGHLTDEQIRNLIYEEYLADGFAKYMETNKSPRTWMEKLFKFLKTLINYFKRTKEIDDLYFDIASGKFRNAAIVEGKSNVETVYSLSYGGVPVLAPGIGKPAVPTDQPIPSSVVTEVRDKLIYRMAALKSTNAELKPSQLYDLAAADVIKDFNLQDLINQKPELAAQITAQYDFPYSDARWLLGAFHNSNERFNYRNSTDLKEFDNKPLPDKYIDVSKSTGKRFKDHVLKEFEDIYVETTFETVEDQSNKENTDATEDEVGESFKDVSFVGAEPYEGNAAFRKLFKYIPYEYIDPRFGIKRTKMVDSGLIFSTLRKITAGLTKEKVVPKLIEEIDRLNAEISHYETKLKPNLPSKDSIPVDIAKVIDLRDQLQAVYNTLDKLVEFNEELFPTKNTPLANMFVNVFYKVDAHLMQVKNETIWVRTESEGKKKDVIDEQRYFFNDIVIWGDIEKIKQDLEGRLYSLYISEAEAAPYLTRLNNLNNIFTNLELLKDKVMVNNKLNDAKFRKEIVDELYYIISKFDLGISYNVISMSMAYNFYRATGKNYDVFDANSDFKKLLQANKKFHKSFDNFTSSFYGVMLPNVIRASIDTTDVSRANRTNENFNKLVARLSKAYESAGEFILKYDPTIAGSVTRNANGDKVNKYVDGTPAYTIVEKLKNADTVEEGMDRIMEYYFKGQESYFESNPFFDLTNPVVKKFWEEFEVNAFAGFSQTISRFGRSSSNDPTTFRGIDDRSYALAMIAMFAEGRREIEVPGSKIPLVTFKKVLTQYEATSTSLLVDAIYKTYDVNGVAKMQGAFPLYVEDLFKALKQEYELMRKNFYEFNTGAAVKKYKDYNVNSTKDRGFRFNILRDFFDANPEVENELIAAAKGNESFDSILSQDAGLINLTKTRLNAYADAQYKAFESKIVSLGIKPADLPKQEGRDQGLLRDFFFNNWINSIFVNQIFDGPIAMGIKNYADFFKRQKSGAAAGPNLYSIYSTRNGAVAKYRMAVVKEIAGFLNNENLETPMELTEFEKSTYVKPFDGQAIGNVNRMIRFAESQSKMDFDAQQALFRMKFRLESDDQYVRDIQTLLDRDIVFNSIKSVGAAPLQYIKQSEHILLRKDVSYLDPTLNKDVAYLELEQLYTDIEFFAAALEQGQNLSTVDELTGEDVSYQEMYTRLVQRAHAYFKPYPNRIFLHNILNSMELHRIEQVIDPNASKKATVLPLDYDVQAANNESYYFDFEQALDEVALDTTYVQVATDKVSNSVTQGIQQKLLLISQLDPSDPEFKDKLKDIADDIKGYQEGLANAVAVQTAKLIRLITSGDKSIVGNLYTTIANGLREQGASANILQYFDLTYDGTPKNDPNLGVISTILTYYYFSLYNKNIFDRKIAGRKFYHISPAGYKIMEQDGKIVTTEEYRKNPEKYPNVKTRYPSVIKQADGTYVVEVIIPKELRGVDQRFIEKYINRFFGTRIPTEDKRSMMVAKIVDYVDEAYGSGIIVPYQVHMLSGSDFDIDTLYAHWYASYYTADGERIPYDNYEHYREKYNMSEDEAKFIEYLHYMSTDTALKPYLDNEMERIEAQTSWNVDQVKTYADYLGGNIATYLTQNERLINAVTDEDFADVDKSGLKPIRIRLKSDFKRLIATFNVLERLKVAELPTSPKELKDFTARNKGVSPVVDITFNKMLTHKMNILSNPYVYERFMADPKQRADKAVEIYQNIVKERKLDETTIYKKQNLYSPTALIVARALNSESKDSLGIAASFNKGISMLATIKAVLNNPVSKLYYYGDNKQLTEAELNKIVVDSVQLVGGAIGLFADAPKNPFPGPLHLNRITTPVMLAMFSIGVPQEAAIMFQSLPAIVDLVDEYNRTYNSAYSNQPFISNKSFNWFLENKINEFTENNSSELIRLGIIKDKKYSNDNYKLTFDVTQIKGDTEEQLANKNVPISNFGYELLNNNGVSFPKEIENYIIMNEFMRYVTLANQISFTITKLTDPMKALRPDMQTFDRLIDTYKKVKKGIAGERVMIGKHKLMFTQDTLINLFDQYPVLKEMSVALNNMDETSKSIFMERTTLVRGMIELFDNVYGFTKDEIISDIKGYIQMQIQRAMMNTPEADQSLLGSVYKNLLDPEVFLDGSIVNDYYSLRSKYPDNTFLQALKAVKDGRANTPPTLLELATSRMGNSQKDQVFTDFLFLMSSPIPDVKYKAYRIAYHGMIKSGAQRARGGYFELLPTKLSHYMSEGLSVLHKDLLALDQFTDDYEKFQTKMDEVISKNFAGISLDTLITDALARTISMRVTNADNTIQKKTLSVDYINYQGKLGITNDDLISFFRNVRGQSESFIDSVTGNRAQYTMLTKVNVKPKEYELFTPVGDTVSLDLTGLSYTEKLIAGYAGISNQGNNKYGFPLYRTNIYGQTLVLSTVDGRSLGASLIESTVNPDELNARTALIGSTATYKVVPNMGTSKVSPLAFTTQEATTITNILQGIPQQLGSERVNRLPYGLKVVAAANRVYLKTDPAVKAPNYKGSTFTKPDTTQVKLGQVYNSFLYVPGSQKLFILANDLGNGKPLNENMYDTFATYMGALDWESLKADAQFADFFAGKQKIHLWDTTVEGTEQVLQPTEVKIKSTDKIIWGHPGLGKTTFREQNPDKVLDFDVDFKPEVAKRLGLPKEKQTSKDLNEWRNDSNKREFETVMREVWQEALAKAKQTGKMLVVSDMMFLKENLQDFDKIITISKENFVKRAIQRGDNAEKLESWKAKIDTIISSIEQSKVITTDKYFSDLVSTQPTTPTDKEVGDTLNDKENDCKKS